MSTCESFSCSPGSTLVANPATYQNPSQDTCCIEPTCKDKDVDPTKCGPDINESSAKETCKKIQEAEESIANHFLDTFGEVMEDMTPGGIIGKFTNDNDTASAFFQNINVNVSQDTFINATAQCSSYITSEQINSINVSDQCAELFLQYTGRGPEVRGVDQMNEADAVGTCALQASIKDLTTQSSTIESTALTNLLSKLSGSGVTNKTDSEQCNNVKSDISSCKYIQQSQCCLGNMETEQKNRIEVCANVDMVNQGNLSSDRQECMQGSIVDTTVNQTSGITISMTEIERVIDDNPMGFIFGGIALVVILVLGYAGYKYYKSKHPSKNSGDANKDKRTKGAGIYSFQREIITPFLKVWNKHDILVVLIISMVVFTISKHTH